MWLLSDDGQTVIYLSEFDFENGDLGPIRTLSLNGEVPEPSEMLLLVTALALLGIRWVRKV